jgi:hypothetical protein
MLLSGISEDNVVQFSLTGANFDVRGGHYFAFGFPSDCHVRHCQPGETMDLDMTMTWGGFGYPGGSGTVNGVYDDNLSFGNDDCGPWTPPLP